MDVATDCYPRPVESRPIDRRVGVAAVGCQHVGVDRRPAGRHICPPTSRASAVSGTPRRCDFRDVRTASACQIISAAEARIANGAAEHRGRNLGPPFCLRCSLKRIVGHFAGEDLFIGLVDCLLVHDTDPSFSPPLRHFQI